MSAGKTMLERKEAQAAQRAGKVVEKIAGLMEARAKGEDIRLEELFALVDGCRDELSVEEIARWKREVGEDWDRIEAPPVEAKPIGRECRTATSSAEYARERFCSRSWLVASSNEPRWSVSAHRHLWPFGDWKDDY